MKRSFVFLIIISLGISGFAQTLAFVHKGEQLPNFAEITVNKTVVQNWGDDENPLYTVLVDPEISIKNLSTGSINASFTLDIESLPSGNFQYCYGGGCTFVTTTRTAGSLIEASDMVNTETEYAPVYGEYGSAKAQFIARNPENTEEVVVLTINFNYSDPTSIGKVQSGKQMNIYQRNGSVELVYRFDSSENRQVCVYDLTGELLQSHSLSTSNGTLALAPLKKGVYLYFVIEKGKRTAVRKFVVS